MSESAEVDNQVGSSEGYNTTTRLYTGHSVPEMDAIGLIIFLGVLVIALPLLPFILVAWVINKLL